MLFVLAMIGMGNSSYFIGQVTIRMQWSYVHLCSLCLPDTESKYSKLAFALVMHRKANATNCLWYFPTTMIHVRLSQAECTGLREICTCHARFSQDTVVHYEGIFSTLQCNRAMVEHTQWMVLVALIGPSPASETVGNIMHADFAHATWTLDVLHASHNLF